MELHALIGGAGSKDEGHREDVCYPLLANRFTRMISMSHSFYISWGQIPFAGTRRDVSGPGVPGTSEYGRIIAIRP